MPEQVAIPTTQDQAHIQSLPEPSLQSQAQEVVPALVPLQGSILVMILYDVCEEIHLDEVRRIVGARPVAPAFKSAAPAYVRFARPPVVERVEPIVLAHGERLEAQIKYYDYGVVSIIFELPFAGEWQSLAQLASSWMWEGDFDRHASAIARQKLERARAALVKPYQTWLSEDYFIFQARQVAGNPSASELLAKQGGAIAQIVRGETGAISENERNEVLQSSISYYPNDLAVIGWNAAFVYDSAVGGETATELLEYANSQLLEFRHYDELLTRELEGVYRSLDRGTGLWRRWSLAREATRLHTVLLDVTELSERADNAIKFLSDMFSARLYRLAAAKVGVIDYKNLVNQKIRTAEDLYRFMVDQFHQARAFAVEVLVVIILIVEFIALFHKPG
ncbi:MAG TPA: hypothetical protein VF154_03190 [Terriglobales bacterium]|jgi:hypothetical protein